MGRDGALQGFFRIGVFIASCGLVMAFLQPRDSGEFVISVCSSLIGLVMMGMVALIVRYDFLGHLDRVAARRAPPEPFDRQDDDRNEL